MTNKNRFNIACIGSHPDDVDLSMGGSVIRMIEKGHKVTLVDLSDGEPTPFGCPEVRQKESQKAASILGVERIQLDMTNRYFEDTIESRKKLAGVLRKLKCEYIFTHYEYDSHPDHVVACRLTEASRFYAKLTKSDIEGEPFYPSKIIYYFPNHIQLSIQPSFLVDTSDYLEKKIEALKCYESQFILSGKQSVLDNIVLCNKYYGFCIGMGSAEPFYLRDSLDIVRISKLLTKVDCSVKQIKEIVMDGTLESLKDKMLSYQQHKGKSPIGFDLKEYQDLKKKLREEVFQILGLASPKNTLIITGHQPDFQHPGIIFKDLLAWKLADISDSTVLHLIVDTDRFEVNYHYPVKLEEKYASTRKVFIGGRDYGIFKNTKMNERDRERFNSVMEESYENLKYFVSENCLLESEAYTKRILSACHKIVPLQFVLSEIKQDFYKSRGIHIHNLPVSKLVELEAFQIFAKKVCERRSEFNKIFNFHLASYREVHKIKNKAQPLPNLEENEYPFWVYDKSVAKRFPMKSYPASLPILPRAITLTMFVRLFLSDLFIHGTGGGRYEAVSDKVINDFFQMEASPYSVATATMHLNENENPENGFMDRRTIEGKLRDFRFSPDRFLEAENPLYLKKRELIAQWSNPNSDRKKLHQETKNLNSIIRQSISSVKEELELRKTKLPIILQTKEALRTRSFPFYYYDMQELIDHINQLQQE